MATSFIVRYDLRLPEGAPWTRPDLYAAFLRQAAYCDEHGLDALVVSEHHGVPDGYLPSPMVMAAAAAAVTGRIPISVAALLANLHDPVRLAEEMSVLDHLSRGRVAYVVALGYRAEEYAMFGAPWEERGRHMEEVLATLLTALTGEPFEYRGRTLQVTPAPFTRPRPYVLYGGGSVAAARRAGRLGLGFSPQVADPALADEYRAACAAAGQPEGLVAQPADGPAVFFCADDPDAFWRDHGWHLLHDARSYDQWHGELTSVVRDRSTTVDEMRQAGVYVVWTPDELVERCRSGEVTTVAAHPLCGGLAEEPSWASLRLMAERVLPALRP